MASKVGEAIDLLHGAEGELAVIVAESGGAATGSSPTRGARPLSDVVTVSDPAVAHLIEGVWLVDDLSQVKQGVAVTVTGEGYDVARGELWRAADAGEAAWLSARAERDRTRAELERVRRHSEAAWRHGPRPPRPRPRVQRPPPRPRAWPRAVPSAAESAAVQAARGLSLRHEQLTDELARSDAARDLAGRDLEAERGRAVELRSALAAHEKLEAERRAAAEAAGSTHAELDRQRRETAEQTARIAAQLAGLNERLNSALAEEERQRTAPLRPPSRAVCPPQKAGAAPRADSPMRRPSTALLAHAAEQTLELRAPARAGVETIEARAGELASELQACAEQEAAEQAKAREATAAATEVEVARARASERVTELTRRRLEIAAQHELEIEPPEEPLEPDAAAALAARLERLERRRESLGAVNPLADEEYEAEKQRVADLVDQCADLDASLKELRSLVRELTETIDARFDETFTSVAKHFGETIATLFPGGSGRLRLTRRTRWSRRPRTTSTRRPTSRPPTASSRDRARGAAGGQADRVAVAALRRREVADGDRVPVLADADQALAVLRAGRGRGGPRRRQHRALPVAAAGLPAQAPSSS